MDSTEQNKDELFASAYEWFQSMVTAWVAIILILVFGIRHIGVEGPSMMQTLHNGNSVIMSNLFFTPKYGDVVVLRKLEFSEIPIIKRVIATEGQTVNIDYLAGTVTVDGVVLDEPYINERMQPPWYNTIDFPLTVPEDHVFVMGDNRNHSNDGRDVRIGLVDRRDILGKAYLVLWPFSDFKLL
ncbi:MAG: signal peptidase I [Oscillospiraceae bacterium]|jgi:signal peptidase I|nr:signal peptidase I [Oscillospiraceae bacterium]